jgi:hypothetical protein
MANDTMLALGAFRFSISTAAYQQLERQSSYKWEEVERFGQAPLMQYCGYDSETISLQGTILPEYKGGLGQMSQMRVQASLGIASSTFAASTIGLIARANAGSLIRVCMGRSRKPTCSPLRLIRIGRVTGLMSFRA